MIRIVPAFGSRLGHAIAAAFGFSLGHAIGVARPRTATADDGRRAPRRQRRAFQGLRIALAVGAITALAATGNPASAAMPPGSCDIADIVQRALPAIVNITVVRVGGSEEAAAGKPDAEHIEVFVGSGSVIDPSGIIVTNKHVIQGAALIRVVFHDKSDVPAQLIAAANLVDLALLKVNLPHPLPTLQFDNSDAARVGQPVIAIGNPLGLGTSVTTGVISALNRDLMRTPFDDFIQTDASINPGNSGGPLLDCAGNMIGVNTALLSNNKLLGSIGLGFALPANDARFVASKLRDPENAMPNWIGLHLQDLTAELAMSFGRPNMSGAVVTGVDPGSPAAQAALVPGDVITAADGKPQPDARAVLRTVVALPPGAPVTLSVWRQDHSTDVTIDGRPWPHMMALRSEVLASAATVKRAEAQGIGMHVTALTPENRKTFGLAGDVTGALIDQVTDGSQAENAGLVPGDVIVQTGNRPVTQPEDVTPDLSYGADVHGSLVALLVHGKSTTRWVSLYVGRVDVSELLTAPMMAAKPSPVGNAAAKPR